MLLLILPEEIGPLRTLCGDSGREEEIGPLLMLCGGSGREIEALGSLRTGDGDGALETLLLESPPPLLLTSLRGTLLL
jgi:hypothetical protein